MCDMNTMIGEDVVSKSNAIEIPFKAQKYLWAAGKIPRIMSE